MFDIERMIFDAFNEVEDPRGDNKRHNFIDIIGVALCATTSGDESWNAIETFRNAKEKWLRKYFHPSGFLPCLIISKQDKNPLAYAIDTYSRECLTIYADKAIKGALVADVLDR